MFSMAFFSMVIRKGNTCRLMTSTSPPKQKKPSDQEPVMGKSCWNSPLFCINRIQPMDAIYGGVIKGTMKTTSSQLCFANWVRASRYAVGTAITVEHSTTLTPSSSELQTVCTFSALAMVFHA